MGFKRPNINEYLGTARRSIPFLTAWAVFSVLAGVGVGFFVLELFRLLGGTIGYSWARVLMGIACVSVGAIGIRAMK